jgi:putative ABC transport system permease protein
MLTDLRHMLRLLCRRPGFTAAAALTLALGIGVTTAVGSLVHGVLWRPLPYPEADRLIRIWESQPHTGRPRAGVSLLSVAHWREHATTLESVSHFSIYFQGAFLEVGDAPITVRLANVGPDFLRVVTGSNADPESGYFLSDSLWRTAFGSRQVTGMPVRRERDPGALPVKGVMPPEFSIPLHADAWLVGGPGRPSMAPSERRSRRYQAIARLNPGVTREEALRELERLSANLATRYPDSHDGWRPEIETLEDVVLGSFRAPMRALLGASVLVLLIAWLNVANLFAARRLETAREAAVRRALGAGRARLARARAAEGALVAALGAVGAAAIAWCTGRVLHASIGGSLPRSPGSIVEWSWFAGIAAATVLVTVLLSLRRGTPEREGPAALRTQSSAGQTRSTSRGILIVVETALALMLIVGAMLLGASFLRLMTVDPGFDTERLVAVTLRQPVFKPGEVVRHYPLERFARTARQAVALANDLPGVDSAAILSFAPFTGERMGARVALLDGPLAGSPQATGAPELADDRWVAAGDMQLVSPEFFDTIGVPVIRGRAFTAQDTLLASQFDDFDAPRAPGVVIVSQSLADRLWPRQNPIGKFVQARGTEYSSSEVVGVVPDLRYGGLAQDASLTLYAPYAQGPTLGATLLVRASGPVTAIAPQVRAALSTLGADLAVGETRTMKELIARETASRRFSSGVMSFFATAGLALAALGLGGTIAFLVRRRTTEIGIRMALGATPADVVRMFVLEVMQLVSAGAVLGLAGAAAGSRLLASLLFGTDAADPLVYIGACVVLVVTAAFAALIPARRAASVDPIVALRVE